MTTNLINGKVYIGKHQTKNLNDGYIGSGKLLKRAIKKYGIKNFKYEILYQCVSEEEMNTKEAELVTEEFCLREDTYNICIGGQGGFSHINRNVEQRILKNRKAREIANANGALDKAREAKNNLSDEERDRYFGKNSKKLN